MQVGVNPLRIGVVQHGQVFQCHVQPLLGLAVVEFETRPGGMNALFELRDGVLAPLLVCPIEFLLRVDGGEIIDERRDGLVGLLFEDVAVGMGTYAPQCALQIRVGPPGGANNGLFTGDVGGCDFCAEVEGDEASTLCGCVHGGSLPEMGAAGQGCMIEGKYAHALDGTSRQSKF